jgi:hypothetical protein
MRRLVLRLVFLALLAGGLFWWSQSRRPRDLILQVDLSRALPGDATEVDVIVRRAGRALGRHDVQYGEKGAPASVEMIVHAPPGAAEVETTVVYLGKPSLRSVARVQLSADAPTRVWAE